MPVMSVIDSKMSAFDIISTLPWCNDWVWFSEPYRIVSIYTFDDGNQRYENYTNSWFVIGQWKGKVALRNISDPTTEISSISAWKTENPNFD